MIKTVIKHYIIDTAVNYIMDKWINNFTCINQVTLFGYEINASQLGMQLMCVDYSNCNVLPITTIRKLHKGGVHNYKVVIRDDKCRIPFNGVNYLLFNNLTHEYSPQRVVRIDSDVLYTLKRI